ncbi:MAG: rhomboid family intramembrane serine protease [Phycisphaerae bacterium]|jgi:membrane associated rhomboid family serine protease
MPIENRPYMQDDSPAGAPRGGYSFGLPRPTRVVGILLLANLAMFVAQLIFAAATRHNRTWTLDDYLGVTVGDAWQVWRYLTFQFLHDTGNLWHLALNMLGLYMLGAPLEQLWGGRRFVVFYLSCGVVAGVAYVILGLLTGLDRTLPIIGASGGVYGILLAAAVLMPHFRLIILFFFVPIRLAAALVFGGMVLTVLSSLSAGHAAEAMSDVAHLGGAAAAAVWIWVLPRLRSAGSAFGGRLRQGAWERAMKQQQAEQEEIDRILQKIHDQGLGSLTGKERHTLQNASHSRRRRDNRLEQP